MWGRIINVHRVSPCKSYGNSRAFFIIIFFLRLFYFNWGQNSSVVWIFIHIVYVFLYKGWITLMEGMEGILKFYKFLLLVFYIATHCVEQAAGGQRSGTIRVPQMIWTLRVTLRKQKRWTWRLSLSTSEVVAAHSSAFLLPASHFCYEGHIPVCLTPLLGGWCELESDWKQRKLLFGRRRASQAIRRWLMTK